MLPLVRGLGGRGRLLLMLPLVLPPTVRALVADEMGALGEGLPAFAAHVGTLPSVCPLVPGEVGALPEGLAAVPAGIGLGTSVGAQVLGDS